MKTPQSEVDAMLKKVKGNATTKLILDVLKGGGHYTAQAISIILNDNGYRFSKRTISARINDIKHKMGYQVNGYWLDLGISGKCYKYHMPLKDNKPIPYKGKKQYDGLKCWACRDDDGRRSFYFGKDEPKLSMHETPKFEAKEADWYCLDISEEFIEHMGAFPDAIFPKSIRPGECEEVVIPMAKIIPEDD